MPDELFPVYGIYYSLILYGYNPNTIGDILNATTIV